MGERLVPLRRADAPSGAAAYHASVHPLDSGAALRADLREYHRARVLASEGSQRMRSVLQKVAELGHTLGMTVICEGIETASQERLLIRCGCEYGQGYLYGKPMPRKDFETFLVAHA